jgi:Tfp pilus assembly PilM family ATPase/Tfp pilus assembly protein PilN
MNIKGNQFLAASISGDTLKVAQVIGSGVAARIVNIGVFDLKGASSEESVRVFQRAFSSFKAKGANMLYVIAPNMLTTKNIEIPSVNADEIRSIVNLQASRHTPFTREEIQIGYINIGVYKKNYSKVLLIIANKNALKEQLLNLQRAGLNFKNVLFSAEAIAGFYARVLKLKPKNPPAAVIDISKNSTEFVVIYKGTAITTRNIPVGTVQLSQEGDAAMLRLIDELSQTMEAYQAEDIEAAPNHFILTRDDRFTQTLQAVLKERKGWQTSIVPYVDHVRIGKNVIKRMAGEFLDHSFLDLVACAAMAKDTKIDMVPEELQLQKSIEEQGREVVKTALLTIVLLIVAASALGLKVFYRNNFLNKLKQDNIDNRTAVAQLEDISEKTKIIQNFLQTRMNSLDTIHALYSQIPNEVYLTSVDLDEEGNVSIQGVSDVASIVFNLGTSLKESEFFQSVDIKSTTSKKDRGKDVSGFEITLKIRQQGEAKE